MNPVINALIATIIVSFISLLGIFLVFINKKSLHQITLFLVSFAIGSLLGDAFIHLIPQSFKFFNQSLTTSLLILLGIVIFFALEKFLRWHHCHEIDCPEDSKSIITLNLIGDSVHNFIDGALIAASFQISYIVGLTTTLAVIFHEIPQEIGDFGILIHHGVSIKKSIIYNFLSSLTSILGVLLVFILKSDFSSFLLPITAGGFIYLAGTDLIPELHRHDQKLSQSFLQLIFILFGIALMFCLTFLE